MSPSQCKHFGPQTQTVTSYTRKIVGTKWDKRGWAHQPRHAKPAHTRIVPPEKWAEEGVQATIIASPERFTR